MGQHEYEYLTEASIKLLDQMTGIDHRSMFNCLYEFEGSFDTGFTLLSVQDILIKRRYVYAIRLDEHPDYERFKAQLEAIRTKGFEHILRNPSSEWELQSNPAIAYWNGAHLCCEAGSQLWERLVREGRLTGADASPPSPIDVIDVAATIASFAAEKGAEYRELLSWWYSIAPQALLFGLSSRKDETARDDESIRRIRDAVTFTKAYEITTDYGSFRYPAREHMRGLPPATTSFLEWWFAPIWSTSSVRGE